MSRTFVHAPAWVKDRDRGWQRWYREVHHHVARTYWVKDRSGWVLRVEPFTGCDLVAFYAGQRDTFCRTVYTGGRNIYCGCRLCTGADWARVGRRRQRHTWRRDRARMLHTQDWDGPVAVGVPLPW